MGARPSHRTQRQQDGRRAVDRETEQDRAGKHGIGRIDHVENRLVGIKSREVYEAPAAVVLHDAHRELETLCLSKQAARFKTVSLRNTPI